MANYLTILFTYLVSRAVHLECVEYIRSETFINALRRVLTVCGPVRKSRLDMGTNFIEATIEFGIRATRADLEWDSS